MGRMVPIVSHAITRPSLFAMDSSKSPFVNLAKSEAKPSNILLAILHLFSFPATILCAPVFLILFVIVFHHACILYTRKPHSHIMIPASFSDKKQDRYQHGQHFCSHNRQPDTIQSPYQGKQTDCCNLKQQCTQK